MNWQDYEHKPNTEVEQCARAIVKRGKGPKGGWLTAVIEAEMVKHKLARRLKPDVLDALHADWQSGRAAGRRALSDFAL